MSALRSWAVALALLAGGLVHAHTGSSSFLALQDRGGGAVHAQFDFALRDLNQIAPLDADADGELTWSEVERAQPRLEAEVWSRSRVRRGSEPCVRGATEPLAIAHHGDGPYVRVGATFQCGAVGALLIDHRGWFDFDAAHRGLVEYVDASGATTQSIVSQTQPQWQATRTRAQRVTDFLREGVRHLVTGYDHLAFLSVLLLALMRRRRVDEPVSLARSIRGAAAVITAFTAAHSLTLALAATGRIRVPSQPVEVAIALSVLCAALLNLNRRTAQHGWPLAFAFGLIHGLGFASALAELAGEQLDWLALAAFNVGIELAQLGIAALAVPLLWWMSRSARHERIGVPMASCALAGVAAMWAIARVMA